MNILNTNIEKNLEHNFLREVSSCPVCRSKKKKKLINKKNQEIGNLYLSQLSKYLNIELFQLLRKLQTYECKNCSTVYNIQCTMYRCNVQFRREGREDWWGL